MNKGRKKGEKDAQKKVGKTAWHLPSAYCRITVSTKISTIQILTDYESLIRSVSLFAKHEFLLEVRDVIEIGGLSARSVTTLEIRLS